MLGFLSIDFFILVNVIMTCLLCFCFEIKPFNFTLSQRRKDQMLQTEHARLYWYKAMFHYFFFSSNRTWFLIRDFLYSESNTKKQFLFFQNDLYWLIIKLFSQVTPDRNSHWRVYPLLWPKWATTLVFVCTTYSWVQESDYFAHYTGT